MESSGGEIDVVGGAWFVEGAGADHRVDDVHTLAGQTQNCLGMGLAAGALPVVVGPGRRVALAADRGERGLEQGAFEEPVAAVGACSPRMEVPEDFVAGASPA